MFSKLLVSNGRKTVNGELKGMGQKAVMTHFMVLFLYLQVRKASLGN
jgi:hypothetical protein